MKSWMLIVVLFVGCKVSGGISVEHDTATGPTTYPVDKVVAKVEFTEKTK